MCTAISFHSNDHYFGRNLDFEYAYQESVTITPRNYPLHFRLVESLYNHFSFIGMAMVDNGYPLYFDATNEYGLSMAGLYFPGNAVYYPQRDTLDNITPFEFIPWILGQCKNTEEALEKVKKINLVNIAYSASYPLSPLHWIIDDKTQSITVEPTKNGLQIYDNPYGVLTNNPPFDYHIHNIANYMNLTREEPENRFEPNLPIKSYSRGMGGIGMPGDLSSSSRFVRAVFTKWNSVCDETDTACITQFFHILGSVCQQEGCVRVGDSFEKTLYSSCCNTDQGVYYYTTYEDSQINGIHMHNADLDSSSLTTFPLIKRQQIRFEN